MGMLTKFGTIWGALPQTAGRIFWVGPASSTVSTVQVDGRSMSMSDGNDGLSPERPLATIAQAISNCTANVGDVIVLLPGTHNLTTLPGSTAAAALAFSKAGITVVGLPYDDAITHFGQQPQSIITAPASTVAAVLTAANLTFLNVGFLGVTGKQSVTYTTACNNMTFRGCYFDLTVGAASTAGITGTGATQTPTGMLIEDCIFATDNTGTSGSFALDVSAAVGYIVRNNTFRFNAQGAGVAAHTTMVKINDNANGLFDGNSVYSLNSGAATITNGFGGVAMTGTGVIRFYRNFIGAIVTNPITGFAASDADIANNIIGSISGGAGGANITVTT